MNKIILLNSISYTFNEIKNLKNDYIQLRKEFTPNNIKLVLEEKINLNVSLINTTEEV